MFDKLSKIIFSALFLILLIVPLALTDFKGGAVSETENRTLAAFPDITENFNQDFEKWIGDNIGLRDLYVYSNAQLQYNVFKQLPNGSYMLGPNGELNFVDDKVIAGYQHFNLLPPEALDIVVDSYQTVNDYLEEQGIEFYYIQNFDKQSIYPEAFPTAVQQQGDISLTDQVIAALKERTTVNVISMKELMLDGKNSCRTYNKTADVTHWSQRGAFMGYQLIMNTINADFENRFKVLSEDDYNITLTDQGNTILGGIHLPEMVEDFKLKEPHAKMTNDKFTLYAGADYRQTYWTNESSDNDLRVLICGDSYIYSFFIDDLAESFYETIELWAWTSGDIVNVINEYQPDIFIYEKAEREPAFVTDMVSAAQKIREYKASLEEG